MELIEPFTFVNNLVLQTCVGGNGQRKKSSDGCQAGWFLEQVGLGLDC